MELLPARATTAPRCEITDAVDVSGGPSSLLRQQEDLVPQHRSSGQRGRPSPRRWPPARPKRAAHRGSRHALRSSILDHGSVSSPDALAAIRLIDPRPRCLLAAYLRSVHDHDDEIIGGTGPAAKAVDPVADRRPRVLAAVIGALVFLATKGTGVCLRHDGKPGVTSPPPPSTPTPDGTPSSSPSQPLEAG